MANIDDLMAAMNQRTITDSDGDLSESVEEETIESEPVADEAEVGETAEDEPTQVEKPADEYEPDTQSDDDSEETQLVEEDSGQRIPKKRFDKVYGELKATERELNTLRSQLGDSYEPNTTYAENRTNVVSAGLDKTDLLETEMLFEKHPEFNPNSGSYNPLLDQMGFEILKASSHTIWEEGKTEPTVVAGISKLEAARRAKARAAALTKQVGAVKSEIVESKRQFADSGMTGRASRSTGTTEPNTDDMSDVELEKYLKDTGQWK